MRLVLLLALIGVAATNQPPPLPLTPSAITRQIMLASQKPIPPLPKAPPLPPLPPLPHPGVLMPTRNVAVKALVSLPPPMLNFGLEFTYANDQLDTNIFWRVYDATNISGPWALYSSTAFTNLPMAMPDPDTALFIIPITTPLNQMFFRIGTSNALSGVEYPPSPIVATPPLPVAPMSQKLLLK